ncbi:hypothetical protein DDY07_03500 [Methylomonas sp. ZR1]|nr:hypothetical protein [Methylomonas sp. ZR1]
MNNGLHSSRVFGAINSSIPFHGINARFFIKRIYFKSRDGFFSRMPRRAPELLNGLARRGDAGMHRVAEGAGSPFRQPRSKASERRIKAASGCLFFWILFFGQAKKSISAVGPRPDIKLSRRDSDT